MEEVIFKTEKYKSIVLGNFNKTSKVFCSFTAANNSKQILAKYREKKAGYLCFYLFSYSVLKIKCPFDSTEPLYTFFLNIIGFENSGMKGHQ